MKQRTKLIATLMAMCLVITLGVFGILAVKTLNMSVGGNITFTADGISFEVSAGEFKTESGAAYTGITTQTGKMQGFAMNTNTKLSDVQDKINSWAGLDLVATESLGDPVLHFSITNKMEDEILSFDPSITLGTNINNNMEIKINPAVANIQPTQEQNFTITFHVKDTSINAGLTGENYSGFAIDILLSTALVAEPSEMPQMTFAPTATDSNKYAISNCSSATGDVVIPSFVKVGTTNYPVTEIADRAFNMNANITSITIPNTVTTIGVCAFIMCNALDCELVIPNSVTTIGEAAFAGTNITSLVLGSSLTTIGVDSFAECQGLTGDLIIPNSVTSIGDRAFASCGFDGSLILSNTLTTIGDYAFQGCSFTGELIIPDSVISIGEFAFNCCSQITSVKIGKGVTTIENSIFEQCSSLVSLIISDSVTTINSSAFALCENLTTVEIGNGITKIMGTIFYECQNLSSITIKATTPPSLGESAFKNSNNCPIYVPAGSVSAYQNDTTNGWNVVEDSRIQAIA